MEALERLFLRKIEDIVGKRRKESPLTTEDKNGITCEDIAFLAVLGANPQTEKGKRLINDHVSCHEETETDCFKGSTFIDVFIFPTPEIKKEVEQRFGKCEWK